MTVDSRFSKVFGQQIKLYWIHYFFYYITVIKWSAAVASLNQDSLLNRESTVLPTTLKPSFDKADWEFCALWYTRILRDSVPESYLYLKDIVVILFQNFFVPISSLKVFHFNDVGLKNGPKLYKGIFCQVLMLLSDPHKKFPNFPGKSKKFPETNPKSGQDFPLTFA